jgi:hypothetical protein
VPERDYLVHGVTGEAGGMSTHSFLVTAESARAAKQHISRSSTYSTWFGERIRRLHATRADTIPAILLDGRGIRDLRPTKRPVGIEDCAGCGVPHDPKLTCEIPRRPR